MAFGQQPYTFHHLNTKDGLASEYALSFLQDSKGFYWIGTSAGLQKYDGYTFSKPLRAGKHVLPFSTVAETSDGKIYISNENDLFQYNRLTEHFIPVSPATDTVKNLQIFEDGPGTIWAINYQALYKYDPGQGKFITWLSFPKTDGTIQKSIEFEKAGRNFWMEDGANLYKISLLHKTITRQESMRPMPQTIWMDGRRFLWLSFWGGELCRYDVITRQKEWYTMPFKEEGSNKTNWAIASCFQRDKNGKLWIGTFGGLWYFDSSLNKPLLVKSDNSNPESFHTVDAIYTISFDKEGSMWIGTDKGLNIFNPSFQQFYKIKNTELPTQGIRSSISQKPFETSKGDILIGTSGGGWMHYDNQFNLKRSFRNTNLNSSEEEQYKNYVTCFSEDKKGKIWIGHVGGLVGIYDPVSGVINYNIVKAFNKHKISGIACDTAGNMWFAIKGTDTNLAKWDPKLKSFKIFHDELLKHRIQGESSILVTKNGDIWIQTMGNGIYRFDPLKEQIAEIYRGDLPPYYIPNLLHGISELNDSIIGIASYTKGVFLFNYLKKSFTQLNSQDGLPSDLTRAIATDKNNNYWVAMLGNFVRVNSKKEIVSFDEADGLSDNGFSYGFTALQDGRLMITSTNGLLYFHPDSIKLQPPPANVLITGFKIDDKPILLDSLLLANKNKLLLTYDQNFITIDYVSISYLNRKTSHYFYRLDGLQKEWINAGTQRFATYANLSPGKYKFRVRSVNRDNINSEKVTELIIIISPPWWRTWWAYVFYGLMLIAGVFIFDKYRLSSIKKKQETEIRAIVATQEEERKRISRDLHDDVGTKLSALKLFISSLHFKASQIENEEIKSMAKSSEQYISETMVDVRQLLVNLSPLVLEEFGYTTAVERLTNKINETNLIQFTLVVFGMKKRLPKDYELILYRITQELINNVLKHAGAKNVSLQIGQRDDKIILMIEDDGKGFDPNEHMGGYGIQNLTARTKLLHGIIHIDSKPGNGTSVLIEIPYKEK